MRVQEGEQPPHGAGMPWAFPKQQLLFCFFQAPESSRIVCLAVCKAWVFLLSFFVYTSLPVSKEMDPFANQCLWLHDRTVGP